MAGPVIATARAEATASTVPRIRVLPCSRIPTARDAPSCPCDRVMARLVATKRHGRETGVEQSLPVPGRERPVLARHAHEGYLPAASQALQRIENMASMNMPALTQ